MGIPYSERDCYALGQLLWKKRRGIEIPDYGYGGPEDVTAWSAAARGGQEDEGWNAVVRARVDAIVDREKTAGCWERVDEPEELDFALYSVMGGRWHLMTVLGGGWALNTNRNLGSHCSLLRGPWERRLDGFYRPA